MGRLQKAQPPVLHEGDVAAAELHLQQIAVVGGPEEHRLLAQRHAGLAPLEDAPDDVIDLGDLVRHRDQPRPLSAGAGGEQLLGVALGGQSDDGVGRVEDRLGRAVVLLERVHGRRRVEPLGEGEDVVNGGGAKGVDGLGVVAHHRDAAAVGPQPARISACSVLVSWYSSTSTWENRLPTRAARAGSPMRWYQ